MWKSMSKGELVVIYIIWLLSAAVFIFGSCHFLGIGEEFIQNIIPSGSIEVSEELASTATSTLEANAAGASSIKDTILSSTGNNPNNILIGLGVYVALATLIYIIVAGVKQRVPAIYFVGIFLHMALGVILIVNSAPLFG